MVIVVVVDVDRGRSALQRSVRAAINGVCGARRCFHRSNQIVIEIKSRHTFARRASADPIESNARVTRTSSRTINSAGKRNATLDSTYASFV
jgi:hypothetical protein